MTFNSKKIIYKKAIFHISFIILFCVYYLYPTNILAATVFSDNFTDINGTPLAIHNNNWLVFNASAYIQNNALYADDTTRVSLPISLTDQCASYDFQSPLLGRKELYLRAKDIPNLYTQPGYYFLVDHPLGYQENFHMSDDQGWLNSEVPLGNLTPGIHNFRACVIGIQLTAYIDDILIANATARNNYIDGYPRIGLSLDQGNFIDNFVYSNPAPSLNISLDVPLLKQTAEPWQREEFDHASAGQFSCGTTLAQCGCATTSVAMILKYYGINKLPNGELLDPGSLNVWLKDPRNHGYNRNLGINWAVAATIGSKAKSLNPDFQYDALEVDDDWSYSPSRLLTDLKQGIPGILQENTSQGMHFIIAKGIDSSDKFIINDPFYNRISLSSYGDTADSMRRFLPANSDMSYISFAVDEGIRITVKDQNGNIVGKSYLDYGPGNPTEGGLLYATPSPLIIFELAKPQSGAYQVVLTSEIKKTFQLDSTFITQNGEIMAQSSTGIIDQDSSEAFILTFDRQSTSGSTIKKGVTFDSTIEDIKELRELDLLHFSVAISTTALVNNAKKMHDLGKDKTAEKMIEVAIGLINKRSIGFVSPLARDIILYDFNELKKLLQN